VWGQLLRGGVFGAGGLEVALLDCGIAGVHVGVGPGQPQEALQLLHGMRMVLDTQVEAAVDPGLARRRGLHDEDRRRLASADVAARGLGRLQRGDQPVGQVTPVFAVGFRHGGPDRGVGHHVCLDGELVIGVDKLSGGGDALRPRVRCDAAVGVDHGDLAHGPPVIYLDERLQHVRCRATGPHPVESVRPIGRIHQRLCGHGADAGLGPGHD